jgi:alpha-tubulin suppressor-like RCC1 family protein
MPRPTTRIHPLPTLALLALLAACADGSPVAPAGPAEAPPSLARLDCTADVRAGRLVCGESAPTTGGALGDLVLGWQRVNVRLASSNAGYDGSTTFSVDVTLQNLLGQPIGTTDGATDDPAGVRVFFAGEPVATGGSGTVTVANADGSAMFMSAQQPYHQYTGTLETEETSPVKPWEFTMPATVTRFAFTVYVSAPVPDEAALEAIDLDPRTLAVGGFHTCALTDGGVAYCWGSNEGAASDSVPVAVSGGHFWRVLSAGRFHTCGITTENAAYCWGDNQTGQLGITGEEDSTTPVPVEGGHEWLQISAGEYNTCGVTVEMDAWCWGDGSSGQLGRGDFDPSPTPVLVAGGRKWATVDVGSGHTCGVTRGGAAFCWGENGNAQLGTGSDGPPVAEPALVAGNHSWRHVSAGTTYTCGVTSLGAAMCWGFDGSGQIGNGAAGSPSSPEAVAGGMEWLRVNAGRETTCGITTANTAYCWGYNNTGEIGDGTTTYSDAPVAVFGGGLWASVSNGDYHTCGVEQSGTARCWGYNLQGQLGIGTSANEPFPQVVSGGHTWAQ